MKKLLKMIMLKKSIIRSKNSNYDNESLFQKKKKAELIEGYQKNLKKLKEKEKIIYQLERRNIIRKKN